MNIKDQDHSLTLVPKVTQIQHLQTVMPIEVKFHVAPQWNGRTNICSNGPGHMTKMAAMPTYGKNMKKSSMEPKGR